MFAFLGDQTSSLRFWISHGKAKGIPPETTAHCASEGKDLVAAVGHAHHPTTGLKGVYLP